MSLRRLTERLSDVGAVAMLAMSALTVADILMKNFLKRPIKGAFEFVELLLVVTIFFGIAEIFRSDTNIAVDIVDQLSGRSVGRALNTIGAAASLFFLLLLSWAMINPALDTVRYPQWSQELGLPLWLNWVPIVIGMAVTIVCSAAASIAYLRGFDPKDSR